MEHDEILRINRRVYDSMAARNDPLCRPAKDEELRDPLRRVDAAGWLGPSIAGRRVLCLAAGGGRQSSLYCAAGADVTVVDLSRAMLDLDRQVALERGLSLRLIETSMEDLSMLRDDEFDIVIQPVSTCYVPDVRPVFAEVARVLRSEGLYISQHKQPVSLQSEIDPQREGGYRIAHRYYRDTPIPPASSLGPAARRLREAGAIEFVHRWEQLVGGMCRAGFVIEDLAEPLHAKSDAPTGTFAERATYMAPYVRIKARRRSKTRSPSATSTSASRLWLPNTDG